MSSVTPRLRFKARLVVALSAAALGATAFVAYEQIGTPAQRQIDAPLTVLIDPGSFRHRLPGEYLKDGKPVDAPSQEVRIDGRIEIMKHQVGLADYRRCVADGVCRAADIKHTTAADVPVTGVSHDDATAYAGWLSKATGARWRLPSDREWAFAAGSRFSDDALGIDEDPANPALRWLADYDKQAALAKASDPGLKPAGHFGENEKGVADLAGNVWEWTSSCYERVRINADGTAIGRIENCGVYVVEGQHRTYMTGFLRDPKAGGCSVGTPPDNLGFRLVRENPGLFSRHWVAGLIRNITG